jgi:hypothetical protein
MKPMERSSPALGHISTKLQAIKKQAQQPTQRQVKGYSNVPSALQLLSGILGLLSKLAHHRLACQRPVQARLEGRKRRQITQLNNGQSMLQGKHTNPGTLEKVLHLINHQENTSQSSSEIRLHTH